ncbi:Negative regulator of differentiation 1 [Paramyrothecium foliicola]|nr:Negative regulator of differentiation 1 [Paramyrothecium foliicola]
MQFMTLASLARSSGFTSAYTVLDRSHGTQFAQLAPRKTYVRVFSMAVSTIKLSTYVSNYLDSFARLGCARPESWNRKGPALNRACHENSPADSVQILSNFEFGSQNSPGLNADSDSDRPATQTSHSSCSTTYGRGLDPTRSPFATPFSQPAAHQSGIESLPCGPQDAETDSSDTEVTKVSPQAAYDAPKPVVPRRRAFERDATRTLQFSNLPDGVTHADITAVVRGGQLLDVFLRRRDGTATVSFLHGDDANAYYAYVRRNDLYINDKRVELSWNERQFALPSHVAQKISFGATRNLVIKHCDPNLTEESIREDLDHIHNIVVIKVDIIADSCFISTNSVSCAAFARSCMMSRLGSRIEWDKDECAQSLDRMPVQKQRRTSTTFPTLPKKRPSGLPINRFQLLNFEEEAADDDDDEQSNDSDD